MSEIQKMILTFSFKPGFVFVKHKIVWLIEKLSLVTEVHTDIDKVRLLFPYFVFIHGRLRTL